MNAAPPQRLRLMTWNIHGGVGPDRRFNLERIAALIARHQPDILALQEVDTRGRDVACLAPLEGLGIGHFAEARTIAVPDGHYGHVLYSRWPTHDIVLHDLSVRRREPRMAIETHVDTPLGPLRVVAVHLGLALLERRRQARKLARMARDGSDAPTVMMGDFNDWFSFRPVRRTLARVLPESTNIRSFPACWPLLRLDRLYCSRRGMLAHSFTDPEARHASDHLPVIADIQLRPRLARAPGLDTPEQVSRPSVDLVEQGERP
ncbi:endonuclease/exonuclease/phosphatase family metal-dependent hydrolase [Ancylobacter aquaticus]|uniref:Endonuclease/exonuclease/phosphatase family metal-dependent hydrolase n=1 Tax=Ancylobacter aquaticus TaxID=100 RepID=A0A4R1IBD6_ANCAQ|nr:endonuclease/exonuclease/phosphatase family protein [Ancylobacter aquaticus]TCK31000.1 endonuclease/exonuclease/phosphatase family metal-dependent hydrolase [Ancylobacter aquaticus]